MHVVQIANHQYHLLLSLKFFGWYGLSDTFTKTWSGWLSCVFVVSSLPAFFVDGSKSFSFSGCSLNRIVSSTTPGSVSLVHGFTSSKVIPFSSDFVSVFKSPLMAKPVALSMGCWTGLRAKSFYSFSFLVHVVQIANHRYHLLLPLFEILWLVWTIWYVYKDLIWMAELCILSFPVCQLCCRWLQIIFISGLFFDSDCFLDYTRLCVTSAWFFPR